MFCLRVYLCAMCVCLVSTDVRRGQALDPLELGLSTVVNLSVGVGAKPWFSPRTGDTSSVSGLQERVVCLCFLFLSRLLKAVW